MLEIKQNELYIHVCIIYPGPDINSPILSPDKLILSQKYFTLLDNVQFSKTLTTPGYFTFPENPPWLPEGECVPLSPTTQFSTSRPPPLITPSFPQNTQKSFENYFDAPSKSSLFPTTFGSLKIPQFHRITPKSHPKITKSQVKSTHSRTKTNNPIITT